MDAESARSRLLESVPSPDGEVAAGILGAGPPVDGARGGGGGGVSGGVPHGGVRGGRPVLSFLAPRRRTPDRRARLRCPPDGTAAHESLDHHVRRGAGPSRPAAGVRRSALRAGRFSLDRDLAEGARRTTGSAGRGEDNARAAGGDTQREAGSDW